jgi:hypothetical protein
MKVNKYGMNMNGLKKASGETCNCNRGYVQISYDRADGEVMAVYQLSDNDWTEYHSESIVTVANTRRHMTMQEIADAIAKVVA